MRQAPGGGPAIAEDVVTAGTGGAGPCAERLPETVSAMAASRGGGGLNSSRTELRSDLLLNNENIANRSCQAWRRADVLLDLYGSDFSNASVPCGIIVALCSEPLRLAPDWMCFDADSQLDG